MRSDTIRLSLVSLTAGALGLVLAGAPSPGLEAADVATAQPSRPVTYTEEQADRGQMLFRRHCLFCHSTNASNQRTPRESLRGASLGDRDRTVMSLGGGGIVKTFPSVYHLYSRIRADMPAWDIDAVSPIQKLDIVAYLLKENGLPSGRDPLPLDAGALKQMLLAKPKPLPDEPGFEPLFNGKDFTNMKFLIGPNCGLPPGCGKTDPTVFSIKDGEIVAHGREHGYLYTEKRYLNFDLRLDYRIVPPPDFDPADEAFFSGGGLFLFITGHKIWPVGIEIEGDNERMLRAYGIGQPITDTYDEAAAARANRGPGPWNSVQIVSRNGQVEAFLNGTLLTRVTQHPFKEPGHIAIQYQGGTWAYRRLRIKSE